jgi:DNA (cytosine-5)-methyltransferase 1
MRLLDLFCCEGGAAMGYHRAGFDVTGVDINPQPNYPFDFLQGDALDIVAALGHHFDVIHASPPCQAHSTITPDKGKHVDLIPATRAALIATGKHYVIENVEGARRALIDPIKLCGSSFGLKVRRHRYFESNVWLTAPACDHSKQGVPVGVYGGLRTKHWARPTGTSRGLKATTVEEAQDAMGMEWATWHGVTQAIPPAYTEFIGHQLMEAIA